MDEIDVSEEAEDLLENVVDRETALQKVEKKILSFLDSLSENKAELLGTDLFHSPKKFMRTLKVLSLVHSLLCQNKQISQRDLYYQLAGTFAEGPQACYREIHYIARELHVSRISLNIYAASRGFVAGQLEILEDSGVWINLAGVGRDGRSIQGNLSDNRRSIRAPHARFVLVVEKEGVFQELSDAKIFSQIPCILVTAHGIPDVATRAFVSRLCRDLEIPALGLVDWNAGGLQVLLTYRFGAIAASSRAAEGSLYSCPHMCWLGYHWSDVAALQGHHKLPMTLIDLQRLNSIKAKEVVQERPELLRQVHAMEEKEVKAELQAVRETSSLVDFVLKKIVRQEFIRLK